MHNQFLGDLQWHFQKVWGIDLKVTGGDGTSLLLGSGKVPSRERLEMARQALREGSLKSLYQPKLETLCLELGLAPQLAGCRTKVVMTDALETWVS